MSDRRIAEKIVIDQKDYTVTIDGEPFPFWLARVGPHIDVTDEGLPVVYLPVQAEAVEVLPRRPR